MVAFKDGLAVLRWHPYLLHELQRPLVGFRKVVRFPQGARNDIFAIEPMRPIQRRIVVRLAMQDHGIRRIRAGDKGVPSPY